MITPDDNARKNYERVKRWREKNRALVNLKQKNYRREKKNLGGSEKQPCKHGLEEAKDGLKRAIVQPDNAPPAARSTIEYLKELERKEREGVVDAPVASPAKFGTYRDDGGRPITERAWNELQKKKERAEKGGYVYDEFSQA